MMVLSAIVSVVLGLEQTCVQVAVPVQVAVSHPDSHGQALVTPASASCSCKATGAAWAAIALHNAIKAKITNDACRKFLI